MIEAEEIDTPIKELARCEGQAGQMRTLVRSVLGDGDGGAPLRVAPLGDLGFESIESMDRWVRAGYCAHRI